MRTSVVLLCFAACTPPPPARVHTGNPGSRGMRADAHLDAARDHARRAKELERWPAARSGAIGRFDDPQTGLWYRAWDTSVEQAQLARTHEAAAAALHASYEAACGSRSVSDVAVSPLRRFGIGGQAIADGVMVFLSADAGSPEELRAALACHRAWMMLGEAGMDACPLDLADLDIRAYGDRTGVT
ncbi:MAG TPA: hypothetical protein VIU61_31000, partial [Kofleriaceae bacterium]